LVEKSPVGSLSEGKETILLVDDEDLVRKLAAQILQKYGYSVLTAANGKEGVQVFSRERTRIDLVILDLIMPEMGGGACLREIMAMAPGTKVIIASGYAADGEMDLALAEGAKICLNKPYEARQLLEMVRQVLEAE
jgi:CheY-like chemotaxis protein